MAFKINTINRKDFLELVYERTSDFLKQIDDFDAFVVKGFYTREKVLNYIGYVKDFGRTVPASWHPCLDGCPDYHRINDEYPSSYVRAKTHTYYFHRWNERKDIFLEFKDIFEMKNHLVGEPRDAYFDNIPSEGVISRIVTTQYPRGGGYLSEHVDPKASFAKIQTILIASDFGTDYHTGGVFMRESEKSEMIMLDRYCEVGDLLVMSPDVRHGVAAVDAKETLNWESDAGRWIVIPLMVRSDYNQDVNLKPRQVGTNPSPAG